MLWSHAESAYKAKVVGCFTLNSELETHGVTLSLIRYYECDGCLLLWNYCFSLGGRASGERGRVSVAKFFVNLKRAPLILSAPLPKRIIEGLLLLPFKYH